jgi:hypothetical protein
VFSFSTRLEKKRLRRQPRTEITRKTDEVLFRAIGVAISKYPAEMGLAWGDGMEGGRRPIKRKGKYIWRQNPTLDVLEKNPSATGFEN